MPSSYPSLFFTSKGGVVVFLPFEVVSWFHSLNKCVVAVWCSLFAWALWGLGFMAQQEAVCCFYAIGYMVWEDADSSSVPTQKWMSCKFTSYHSTGRCDLQIAMKRAFLCVCNGRHVLRALPANWCLKLDIKLVRVNMSHNAARCKYKFRYKYRYKCRLNTDTKTRRNKHRNTNTEMGHKTGSIHSVN